MVQLQNQIMQTSFEGPEKILEVQFSKTSTSKSLRNIPRETWDEILKCAHCEILSKAHNEHVDAYVLSESSLFVYDDKVFIKTCGTTTLLLCLEKLISAAQSENVQMQPLWIGYSRKNFLFPDCQRFPHESFNQEVEFTSSALGKKLHGAAFVLGDFTSDHCFVYVADLSSRSKIPRFLRSNSKVSPEKCERNLNIMMYDLDPTVTALFYQDNLKQIGKMNLQSLDSSEEDHDIHMNKMLAAVVRKVSGMDKLSVFAEGECIFDDVIFEPCGYSMNAIKNDSFYTVHVTPENHCCYASFETNALLSEETYLELLEQVLTVFKPSKFTMTMFSDKESIDELTKAPVEFREIKSCDEKSVFIRTSHSGSCFAEDYLCQLANFVRI